MFLTYRGHGTDKALMAGLLGMFPDDERIRDSFATARDAGLTFSFAEIKIPHAHPNTARLHLFGRGGKECVAQGASVGSATSSPQALMRWKPRLLVIQIRSSLPVSQSFY
ncbi:MAG: hypothetical protein LBJ41_12265 [Treponema sp.]|jgi:iron-sulfur-dependent L-serine dehydratase beta subunit|nr:hypothetical protein [Treponema sp.]